VRKLFADTYFYIAIFDIIGMNYPERLID